MNRFNCLTFGLFLVAVPSTLKASEDSMGPNGINSTGLEFTGMGVAIGQVEGLRPGKFGFDSAANCCNDKVVPAGVFARTRTANENEAISDHPLWVASVMISKQTTVDPNTGMSPPIGVAQDAALYSSALIPDTLGVSEQQDAAVTAQHLAKTLAQSPPFAKVRAINMSFGVEFDASSDFLDGNSTLTQFVDWSTFWHDVLYVIAGPQPRDPIAAVPTDNYNGITVGWSRKADDGVFRRVVEHRPELDPVGVRTATDIIAPGFQIDVAGANGSQPPRQFGTSFAAPHVTGTIALLQQQAAGFHSSARFHETMKAIILNSADKIKGYAGMERTVVMSNGTDDWLDSVAYTNPNIPLDPQMGVGHLNAKRASEQLAGGRHAPGGVPLVGWDFRTQNDPNVPNVYTLSLSAGDWVVATLVWDRLLLLNSPFLDYAPGDEFIDFGFVNLELYLVPAGQGINQAVASSTSSAWNLEHFFASVPDDGPYELQVVLNEFNSAGANYALAWWAGPEAAPTPPGDHNGDGNVDAADYVSWRKSGAGQQGYDDWKTNFGTASAGSGGSLASVPEPAAIGVGLIGLALVCGLTRRLDVQRPAHR